MALKIFNTEVINSTMCMDYHKLTKVIENSHLGITGLFKKLDMDRGSFYYAMRKETLKVSTLEKICKVLDVEIWQFFMHERPANWGQQQQDCEKELLAAYRQLNALREQYSELQTQIAAEKPGKYKKKDSNNS